MQNGNSTLAKRASTWLWMARQCLFVLLTLLLLGFACACIFSKREPLIMRPEIPLPSGSLIFTNHFAIFRLDSKSKEPVTELYTSTVEAPVFSPNLSFDGSRMTFIWKKSPDKRLTDQPTAGNYPRGIYLLDLTQDQSPELLWWARHDPGELWWAHSEPGEIAEPWPSSPRWSTDEERIVLLVGNSDRRDIYRLNLDTLVLEQVHECEGYCQNVSTASTSGRLLFTSIKGQGDNQVGAISLLENGTTRILFQDKGVDYVTRPSWSPDESQIALTMETDEKGWRGVFLLNADGTGLIRLTHKDAYYYSPVWSPDGEKLAFVQESWPGSSNVTSRIVLMDLQTLDMQTLLTAPWKLDELQWLK